MDAHGGRRKSATIRPGPPNGTRVEHTVLGPGTVVDYGSNEATVSFDNPSVATARVPVAYLTWAPASTGDPITTERVSRNCTDAGNALRLVDRYGTDLRYVPAWKEWLVWEEGRWRRDALGRVMELAKDTARGIYGEAEEADDSQLRADLAKWARSTEHANRLKAMVELARTNALVAIDAEQLDTDPWLLNCANVTIDLRNGSPRPPRRDDLLTKTTGVTFDPKARCPEWERFVLWAMGDRPELVEYLQRALGYSLTGIVSERLIFFLHGAGRNGKSTLLEVFQHVLGDYALKVESAIFERQRSGRDSGAARPELVQLKGARFVTSSELEDGTRLATALVKELTGNETISARALYKAHITFKPQFKPWIAANHKPNVPADDQAIWDRLRLIPFDARVDDKDQDDELADRLKAEASGILAWAIRGCAEWRTSGLQTPAGVVEATTAYRNEMDAFSDFIDWLASIQEDVSSSGGGALPAIDYGLDPLRRTYNRWAQDESVEQLSTKDFKAAMMRHGFTVKTVRGKRSWQWPTADKPVRVDYAALARRYQQQHPG